MGAAGERARAVLAGWGGDEAAAGSHQAVPQRYRIRRQGSQGKPPARPPAPAPAPSLSPHTLPNTPPPAPPRRRTSSRTWTGSWTRPSTTTSPAAATPRATWAQVSPPPETRPRPPRDGTAPPGPPRPAPDHPCPPPTAPQRAYRRPSPSTWTRRRGASWLTGSSPSSATSGWTRRTPSRSSSRVTWAPRRWGSSRRRSSCGACGPWAPAPWRRGPAPPRPAPQCPAPQRPATQRNAAQCNAAQRNAPPGADGASNPPHTTTRAPQALKGKLGALRGSLGDPERLREVYTFAYGFTCPRGQKCLQLEESCALWELLLGGRYPLLDKWLSFVRAHHGRAISRDTWTQFLEFTRSVKPDLSNYDADGGAWPYLIDEFVEHARKGE